MKKLVKTNSNIERNLSSSEIFIDAVNFFTACGCTFINHRKDHRYSLSILIDDSLKRIKVISPFTYAMSRNTLAGLYTVIIKDERFGGKNRIKSLIKVINDIIYDGYEKGKTLSYDIETGYYIHTSMDVLSTFFDITSKAIKFSLPNGYEIEHLGDIYVLLGGEAGCKRFFNDVFNALHETIMSDVLAVRYIPNIKCYTCKHCRCINRVRICNKVCTSISGIEYDENPGKYFDAHHSGASAALVSAVIDERMDRCNDYECRIK